MRLDRERCTEEMEENLWKSIVNIYELYMQEANLYNPKNPSCLAIFKKQSTNPRNSLDGLSFPISIERRVRVKSSG